MGAGLRDFNAPQRSASTRRQQATRNAVTARSGRHTRVRVTRDNVPCLHPALLLCAADAETCPDVVLVDF